MYSQDQSQVKTCLPTKLLVGENLSFLSLSILVKPKIFVDLNYPK